MGGKLEPQMAKALLKFSSAAQRTLQRDAGVRLAVSRSNSPQALQAARESEQRTEAVFDKMREDIESVSRSLNVRFADQNIKAAHQKATERTQSRSPVATHIKVHLQIPEGANLHSAEEKGKTNTFFQKSSKNSHPKKRPNTLFSQMNFTATSIKHSTKVSTPKSQADLSIHKDIRPSADQEYQLNKPGAKQLPDSDLHKKLMVAFQRDPLELIAAPAQLKPTSKYILNSPAEAEAVVQKNKADMKHFKKVRAGVQEAFEATK